MITLVLGGTRSGKSAVAERFALSFGTDIAYIATAVVDPNDAGLAERVAIHKDRRPSTWATIECGADLPGALLSNPGPVLVDSLGTWVSSHWDFVTEIDPLIDALTERKQPTIIVSEEVGLGVHPATELGLAFADALGEVNQRVAAVADRVVMVVAGRVLELPAATDIAHEVPSDGGQR